MRGLREFFRNPSGWNRVLGGVGVVVAFVLVVALAFVGIQGTVGYAFANAPRYVLSDAYTQYVSPGSPSAIENFGAWLLLMLAVAVVALILIIKALFKIFGPQWSDRFWLFVTFKRIWQWLKDLYRYPAVIIDRILSSGIRSQLLLLAGIIVAVFVLFVIVEAITGSVLTIKDAAGGRNLWLDVYYHFVDPGNQYGVEGGSNKLLVSIISITGSVLMGGVLISIISNIIDRRVERAREGQISYKFRNHYVIIGFDKMAIGLIKQLYRKAQSDNRVKDVPYLFVIQTTSEVETVRHELLSKLDAEIDRRTIILHGGRDSREDLEALRLPYCREIFLLGEEGETDHDSVNIECVTLVNRILRNCYTPKILAELKWLVNDESVGCKRCHVLFEAQSTFAVFQREGGIEDFFKRRSVKDDMWFINLQESYKNNAVVLSRLDSLKQKYDEQIAQLIDFLPFNFYETWAEKVLVWGKYDPHNDGVAPIVYTPLDGEGIDFKSNSHVHLVIVGMTSMGVALAMKAAHIAHYPNFVRDSNLKTRITFIDLNADTEFDMLRGRYSALFEQCDYRVVDTIDPSRSYVSEGKGKEIVDIEFEFIKGAVESRPVQEKFEEWSKLDDSRLLTIAICFEVPQKSIATALYMPQDIYSKALSILVRQNVSCSTIELVGQSRRYNRLKAFGMLDECYDIDDNSLLQAKRVNFIYNRIKPQVKEWLPLVDAQADELWKGLSTVHRWSNIYNAHSIPTKLRSFGLEEPENLLADKDLLEEMAKVEHNRWVMERLIQGYRPTTPEEDQLIKSGKKDKKEIEKNCFAHIYLKPYDQLDEKTKDNDRMIMKYLWRINKPLAE